MDASSEWIFLGSKGIVAGRFLGDSMSEISVMIRSYESEENI